MERLITNNMEEEDIDNFELDVIDDSWFDPSKVDLNDAIDKFKFHVNRMNDNPKFTIEGIDCYDIWFKLDEEHSLNISFEPHAHATNLWVARLHKYNSSKFDGKIIMSQSEAKIIAHFHEQVFYNHITEEEV